MERQRFTREFKLEAVRQAGSLEFFTVRRETGNE